MIRIIKYIFWGLIFIVFFAFIVPTCAHNAKEKAKKEQAEKARIEKENPAPQTQIKGHETMEWKGEGYVSPGNSWTTSVINYNARFRTDGHAIYIQFTSKDGGWTKTPYLLPKEGCEICDIPMPSDIADPNTKEIKALITVGPDETTQFKVWLYEKS